MEKYILSLLLCSAEMSAVALVYIALLRALKNRQAPVLRYYSWLVILAGFLIPFKPRFGNAAITVPEPAAYVPQNFTAEPESGISVCQILFWVWLAGALVSLILCAVRYSAFRRGIHRLSVSADRDTSELAESIARELGTAARVKVAVMKEITSPMMTGLTAPIVLLPDRHFDSSELRLILKHELTHFKHRDLWIKLLFTVCRSVHWFDPVMLLIDRSIGQECEHYCDRSVISGEDSEHKKLYCKSILDTVSARRGASKPSLRPVMATNFYTPKQGLKHRLELIISDRRKRVFVLAGMTAAVLTAVSGSIVSFADSGTAPSGDLTDTPSVNVTTTSTANRELQETTAAEQNQRYETTTAVLVTTRPSRDTSPAVTSSVKREDEMIVTTIPVREPETVETTVTYKP